MLESQTVMENRSGAASGPVRGAEAHGRMEVRLCNRTDPERPALEAFVQLGFRQTHAASVRSFMPFLVGLRDPRHRLIAVAGYRPAQLEPLYLEQYLEQPIERAIEERRPGLLVARADVAEIGNFACRDSVAVQAMVAILARLLRERRHHWVVFTATRAVRRMMRRFGIRLAEIARADPSRIVTAADDWGGYYDADPRVMLGYVPEYRGTGSLTWRPGTSPPSSTR